MYTATERSIREGKGVNQDAYKDNKSEGEKKLKAEKKKKENSK